MPKGHSAWVKYIKNTHKSVHNTEEFIFLSDNPNSVKTKHFRQLRLKVAPYPTSWLNIVQYEASLYYAFATRGMTFVDDQIYRRDSQTLLLNHPHKDMHGHILALHPQD